MANGKSSAGFWVLISTLLVGGGVGIYFLLRKDGKSEDGKSEEEKKAELEKPKDDVSSSSSSSSSSNTYVAPKSFTFPFKSVDEGNTFRAWVIKKDPTFAKSIDLSATGKLNSYVQKAWDKYGADFKKTPDFKGFTTVVSSDAKKRILDFATGNRATETFLNSTNQDFVKKWAETIGNEKTAFIWANQVYRTKTGERVMDFNPTSFNLKTTKDAVLRATANQNSTGTPIKKGESLGKGSAVAFSNPYLYIYLPNKKKWIWSKVVAKASSSFTGGEEEIWAGFDNNFDITFK